MKFSILPALVLLHTAATAVTAVPNGPVKTVRAEVEVVEISPAFTFNEADGKQTCSHWFALSCRLREHAYLTNCQSVFAIIAPQGCSILSCVSVIGQAVCIAGAIASGNVAALLGCASKKKVSHSTRSHPIFFGHGIP